MKVLIIMGSPRKGNTYNACEEFREYVQKDCAVDFEYVWLKDIDMKSCRGCFTCFPNGENKCPIKDDVRSIVKKMDEADGVVFASPVYSNNVSGLIKSFIDRISYIGHRPRFFGKKAFFISTTGMFGTKNVNKYLASVTGDMWHFDVVGSVGIVTLNDGISEHQALTNSKLLRKAAGKYAKALNSDKGPRPNFKEMVIFHSFKGVMLNVKTVSPADYEYWNEKGWLAPEKKYYVDVPINPVYLVIARSIGKLQTRKFKNGLNV